MLDALILQTRRPGTDAETQEVIREARAGNVEAFETLIRRYERRVLKLAYQMVGNLDDAQDVSQDVFLRLWRYLGKMRDEARFATWLYRLVVNASYDLLNRRKASYDRVALEDGAGRPLELADERLIPVDRDVVAQELKDKVLEALDRLTPSERTVFVLKDLEGLEVKDVARIHDSSPITVRRHLSNARHKLRGILTELYPGFGGAAGNAESREEKEEEDREGEN